MKTQTEAETPATLPIQTPTNAMLVTLPAVEGETLVQRSQEDEQWTNLHTGERYSATLLPVASLTVDQMTYARIKQ
jgi:hypothetical protein